MKVLEKIFGDANAKFLKSLEPVVQKINGLEKEIKALTDEQLKQKTVEFRRRLRIEDITPSSSDGDTFPYQGGDNNGGGETIDDILPEAFAVVREASRRVTGMRHFDVQLIGGMVLHQGQIAEMKTGEGKTLVATLPMYLNALTGKGAHLVTVNDYLARRDAVWMGKIYDFLGMSVGCIQQQGISYLYDANQTMNADVEENSNVTVDMENLRSCSRKDAYAADITYGTNNEFGFDYLRDNMAIDTVNRVQRELHYSIVDEVDSILIDEARTPLIISAPAEESAEMYYQFALLARQLKEDEDYNVDEKMRAVTLNENGINRVEKMIGQGNIYTNQKLDLVYHIENALKAKALFMKDRDYVVKDGEVIIVDEFTGRLMIGRRYSEGLHQAIEAKENVKIQRESQTLASITFQNLFRMYEKLSGMTGTAYTEAEEFYKIYGLEVAVIPTNKPIARKDMEDSIYRTERGKYTALIKEVKRRVENGQPVLIGTVSIEKNELLDQLLAQGGVTHEILNAKNHAREAEIIAQAGRPGAVTVATNMAGRGVDIMLGGQPYSEEMHQKVVEAGGLHVIGTERHESRRIDNQLRGRSGRQGDAGSTQFYISMEDDLMRVFGSDRMKSVMTTLKVPEDMPIENRLISKSIETAQKKIEGHNFDIRKHLVQYDDVINKHREVIYKKRAEVLEAADKDIAVGVTSHKSIMRSLILDTIADEIEQVVSFHTNVERRVDWNTKEILETIKTIYPVTDEQARQFETVITAEPGKKGDAEVRTHLIDKLTIWSREAYEKLEELILAGPMGEDRQVMRKIEKAVYLRSIDNLWIEHLDTLDHIRQGIGLRGYGQRDPLIEYKKEADTLFNELLATIQNQVVYSIFKVAQAQNVALKSQLERRGVNMSAPAKTMEKGQTAYKPESGGEGKTSATESQAAAPVNRYDGKKVGRNEPCPCGSGKKFKHCHGK